MDQLHLRNDMPNIRLGEFVHQNGMVYLVKAYGETRSDVVSYKTATIVENAAVEKFHNRCSVELIEVYPAWKSDPDAEIDVSLEYNVPVVHEPIQSNISGEVVFVGNGAVTIKNERGQEVKIDFPSPRSPVLVKPGDRIEPGTLIFDKLPGLTMDDIIQVSVWRVVVL